MRSYLLLFLLLSCFVAEAQLTSAPGLQSPSTSANGERVKPNFRWTNLTGANSYELQLDTVTTFNSGFLIQLSENSNTVQISDLRYGQRYYWRVRGVDGSGPGPWSNYQNFTTLYYPEVLSFKSANAFVASTATTYTNGGYVQHEFDTSINFNSPRFHQVMSPHPDTASFIYYDLHFKEKYYVRSRGITARDTSEWTPLRSFTTLGGSIVQYPNVNSLKHTYTWSKGYYTNINYPGTSYEFELDSSASFTSPALVHVATDSLFFEDTSSTRYRFGSKWYIRTRTLTPVDTSDWFATNFTIYNSPELINPKTNLKDPLPLFVKLGTHPDIDYYICRWDTVSDFSSVHAQSDTLTNLTASPEKYFSIPHFEKYWFGVRGVRGLDTSGETLVSFQISDAMSYQGPSNNTTNRDVEELFQWATVKYVDFELQYDTVSDFSSAGIRSLRIPENKKDSLVGGLYYGVKHYWRMRVLSDVDSGRWQGVRTLTTKQRPILTWPKTNDTGYTKNWDITCDAIGGSDYYEFAVSEDINFGNAYYDTASYDPVWDEVAYGLGGMPLKYSTKYYWKARAIHARDTSDWSTTWNLTTAAELPKPAQVQLVSPANGTINLPVNVTCEWKLGAGDDAYWFQYGEDPNFGPTTDSTLIFFIGNVNPTEELKNLKRGATYYWRVKAENSEKQGDWSTAWKFTILPKPFAPTLIFPVGVSNQGIFVKLRWQGVPGATSYRYRIGESSDLSTVSPISVTDTIVQVGPLKENTVYYWHVNSLVGTEQSSYSATAFFGTGEGVGIIDLKKDEIQVYPNPSSKQLFVTNPNQIKTWKIVSADGSREGSGESIDDEGISILSLSPGLYVLRVWTSDGVQTIRFIKN